MKFSYNWLRDLVEGLIGHSACERAVAENGDDRVVLGTDTPFDMGDGPLAAQLGETDLSDESLRRISYGNAELLFRRQDGS